MKNAITKIKWGKFEGKNVSLWKLVNANGMELDITDFGGRLVKALVPDPKKQRALSTYLNQLCLETLIFPSNHLPYDSGVEAQKLPGSSALVNRNLATGLYTNAVLDTTGHAITQDLQVSPDGKTATLTQSISADLAAPGSNMDTRINFGQVTLSQRLVINLEPEVPVATEVKIFQEFTDKI